MAIEVTMPRLSDTMEAGSVVKWHVNEGDEVSSGDVLADIETDKATMELESFDDGVVAKLAVAEGEQVDVGALIIVLAEDGEDVSEAASSAGSAAKAAGGSDNASASTAVAEPPATTSTNGTATSTGANGERVFASPLARKVAAEKNVDLAGLTGSGPSGRIVRKDVEAAASSGGALAPAPAAQASPESAVAVADTNRASAVPAPAAPVPQGPTLESQIVPLSNMRGIIARRLVESKTTIPHYQVTVELDAKPVSDLRKQLNEQLAPHGVKLTVNDFVVRATALAMHQHPFINSSWEDSTNPPSIKINGEVNIGVAIALPMEKGGGLVVATIRSADALGLRHISQETKRLAGKAREKGLSPQEMDGATFTISNLGMFGVDEFTAIVNPPNAAILAVGGAIEQPVVEDGQVVPGLRMKMTMSSDHRIIDGAMAAQYLNTVKQLLENPATLLV